MQEESSFGKVDGSKQEKTSMNNRKMEVTVLVKGWWHCRPLAGNYQSTAAAGPGGQGHESDRSRRSLGQVLCVRIVAFWMGFHVRVRRSALLKNARISFLGETQVTKDNYPYGGLSISFSKQGAERGVLEVKGTDGKTTKANIEFARIAHAYPERLLCAFVSLLMGMAACAQVKKAE